MAGINSGCTVTPGCWTLWTVAVLTTLRPRTSLRKPGRQADRLFSEFQGRTSGEGRKPANRRRDGRTHWSWSRKKEECRTRHCSRDADQGAQQNSARPAPLSGCGQGCFCWIQERFRSGWSFPLKQFSTHTSLYVFVVAKLAATMGVVCISRAQVDRAAGPLPTAQVKCSSGQA